MAIVLLNMLKDITLQKNFDTTKTGKINNDFNKNTKLKFNQTSLRNHGKLTIIMKH